MKRPRKKKIIIGVIILLIICGVVFAFTRDKNSDNTTITKAVATRGTVATSISGSGTVAPIEEYTISSVVKGEILSDNVALGAKVNKGDFLYSIDSSEAENSIRKAEIALEKQKLTYSQTEDSINNLTVTSSISGRISNLYVKEGDDISNNGKIADIIDSDTLIVKLPFNKNDAAQIKIGQSAEVYLDSTGESFAAEVTKVSSGSYATSTGAPVSDIELRFTNPGAILSGESVTAIAGNFACNSSGKVEYKDEMTLMAKTSGTVKTLKAQAGDKINKGDSILILENDSAVVNSKSGELSLQDSEIALQDSKNALDDYYITSPISGTVIQKDYKAGEALDSNKTTLAIIADMSKLSFSMNIDELDIKSISMGQEVEVTADALSGAKFKGHITEISILGNSSSGVTTYPVTVVIDEYEGLLPGMNVNANIVSEKVENVVRIPVEAVSRGNAVLVKEDYANSLSSNSSETTTKQNKKVAGQIVNMPNTPEGYKWIKVDTGLSDDEFIEIKSGLEEGTEVFIISKVSTDAETTSASTSKTQSNGMMMGGGAIMGGGNAEWRNTNRKNED